MTTRVIMLKHLLTNHQYLIRSCRFDSLQRRDEALEEASVDRHLPQEEELVSSRGAEGEGRPEGVVGVTMPSWSVMQRREGIYCAVLWRCVLVQLG